MVRPHLESISLVVALAVSGSTDHRRGVALSLLREAPVTGDFLVVLEADFDSLASVNAHTIEVKRLRVESKLGDRDICNEVNGIFRTVLDVDRDSVLLLAKLGGLARG